MVLLPAILLAVGGTFPLWPASHWQTSPVNDDAQLIDDALKGQSAAFGHLVTRYQDRLYHSMVQVLGSAEDARDVVQDAFVQAFIKLRTFQGSSAFYTWLYRIAFNLAVSSRRRRKPTQSIDQSRESAGEEPADGGAAPSERLEREELSDQVKMALGLLSEEHRAVLVLREMDGCDYETISQMLDMPVGTVRSRLHRARMQMREQLKAVLQEDG
ncbi:MAG: RNA polymerase sigma factor [Pirellulales bacterium]